MPTEIRGRICRLQDEGSIVLVTVIDADMVLHVIPCDRRCFGHMYEGQRGRLLDRPVTVIDEAGTPLAIQFDDVDEDEVVYPPSQEVIR